MLIYGINFLYNNNNKNIKLSFRKIYIIIFNH